MFNERDIERHVRRLEPPPDWHPTIRLFIRLVIVLIGFIVLLMGIVMIVLPGPAFIVIPAGLAILASQFRWAKELLYLVMSFYRWLWRQIKPLWQRVQAWRPARPARPARPSRYVVINRKDEGPLR